MNRHWHLMVSESEPDAPVFFNAVYNEVALPATYMLNFFKHMMQISDNEKFDELQSRVMYDVEHEPEEFQWLLSSDTMSISVLVCNQCHMNGMN